MPQPTGLWEFNDAGKPLAASVGADLELQGTHATVEGHVTGDGAYAIGVGSFYRAQHGIPTAPGQTRINAYTFVVDFKTGVDTRSHGIFQTDLANIDGGEIITLNREGVIGAGFVGWSPQFSFVPGEWYRFIVAADLDAGRYDLYLNGECVVTGAPQDINRRYSLDPEVVLFFSDPEGEHPLTVSRIAVYDHALLAADIKSIGRLRPERPENTAPVFTGKPEKKRAKTGEPVSFEFSVADKEGDRIRYQLCAWDGRPLMTWSELQRPEEKISMTHTFNYPMGFGLYLKLQDEYGAESSTLYAEIDVAGEPRVVMLTAPYMMNLKKDGVTLMWEINEPVLGSVRIDGRRDGWGADVQPSGFGTYIYKVVLFGLEPSTTYSATVMLDPHGPRGDESYHEEKTLSFTTSPDSAAPFTFGVWSDSQGHNKGSYEADPYEPTNSMMRHMAASDAAFGVACGDMAEDGGAYEDTRKFYLDRVARYLGTKKPFFVAWGNHDDYRGAVLRKFASFPSEDIPGYDAGYGSYSFDYAGCHFVCIDYATQYPDIFHWLEKDLKANQNAKFTFLFIHEPPYCELWIDGESTQRSQLVPLMERYGVDACFSGHTHEYERGYKNGVYYCITGGGSWLDHGEKVVKDWPHMTVGGAQNLTGYTAGLVNQYMRVSVGETSWKAEAIAFQPDGKEIGVIDSFSSDAPPSATEYADKPVTHAVYFWLSHELTDENVAAFQQGLESLRKIDGVISLSYGRPLAGNRPVIDDSYSIGLTIILLDDAALERYLADPIHQEFLKGFGKYWTRATVLDYR
ncbi:MAG: metallophosphoesterase [Candidatus Hydrogenedentes bacterium]|nr:metallophosphoesterase [Candidatus Hydrogenedentota bacterium]